MEDQIQILFIWSVPLELQRYFNNKLSQYPSIHLIFLENPTEEELLKYTPHVDVIIGWRPTDKIISTATNLRFFINPGAGIHHLIPLLQKINKERSDHLINLINGHGNAYFTAQHTIALLLNLTNQIIPHHLWMKSGKWRTGDREAKSLPLRYQSIGLLGFGAVNQHVYRFLRGFDSKIFICRKDWKDKDLPDVTFPISRCYSISQFDEFLAQINILIIAIPHTHLTEGLIHRHEIELMKSPRLLVNISRGVILDEQDLFYCLQENILLGAGIDVWYNESPSLEINGTQYPYSSFCPFHSLPNVILSPHRAASPFDDLHRWDEVIENLIRISKNRKDLLNYVNINEEY